MTSQKQWKEKAAKEAAKLVEDDMTVGLGSGSTLAKVVKQLAKTGTDAKFVTASAATQQLASKMDLDLTELKKNEDIDLTIDGADELDRKFTMLKGGGGAHTRERVVANAAKKFAIVVDRTKLVDVIGESTPLPVEVIPFAHEHISGLLEKHGGEAKLRKSKTGGLYVTDNGNYIFDLETGTIDNPEKFSIEINQTPGVVDNGIFTDRPDKVFIGHEEGCKIVETDEELRKFSKQFKT